MAECNVCGQEMRQGVGCTFAGDPPRVPNPGPDKCHDCACPAGALHHPGCDSERCAICGGQAISCGHDNVNRLT
jgi:hypothetical protein